MQGTAEHVAIESYLGWWRDAGVVDAVADTPADWLAAPRQAVAVESSTASAPAVMRPPTPPPAASPLSTDALPDSLADFDAWLATDPALPGAKWSRHRVLPAGPEAAPLMIIGDVPDDTDIEQGAIFAGPVGALLDAMLAAVGHDRSALRLATIALTQPLGGRIDRVNGDALAAIMLHHIHLIRPQHVVLLGDQCCKLLTGKAVGTELESLRVINHYGVTTAASVIHHPRLLIERPVLKRSAWNVLKLLKDAG
jgi:uracil-DNA glycosylase